MLKQSLTIALSAATLVGTTACERDKTEESVVEAVEDAKQAAEIGTPASVDERIKTDIGKRLDEAQAQYAKLEQRAAEAKKRIEARGGEARTELEQEIEQARLEVKRKLELARKASLENAKSAVDELDKALDSLEAKLEKYGQT